MRVAIIGASHAGIAAAKQLKLLDATIEVVLIERTHSLAYLASTLHLVLGKQMSTLNDGHQTTLNELITQGIHVMLDTTVQKIHAEDHYLELLTIDQTVEKLGYDRLILAMGSTQPQIPYELQTGEITTYKGYKEAQMALEEFQEATHVSIIGAGLIGLELADSLYKEKEVVLIDRMDDVLFRYFDSELTQKIRKHLDQNVTLYLGETVQSLEKSGNKQVIELNQLNIKTDVIVYAVNPRPSIYLVQDFLAIDSDGTIQTNEYLQTSHPDIYAIGDLISLPFKHTNETSYIPLLSNAITSGLVAAQNIVFNNQLKCPSVQRTVASSFFGLHVASSGLTQEESPYYGISSHSSTKTFYPKSSNYGQDTFVTLKLVYTSDSNQLIGGQLLTNTSHYIDWIDLISLAINQETTIDELAVMDFYFQPLFNEPIHPISRLALDILTKNKQR